MSNESDKYRRRSIRLKGSDYSQTGAYFLTICAQNRESLFGEVADGQMRINGYGQIVYSEWLHSADIQREIELDVFQVMPDHLHGIVLLK